MGLTFPTPSSSGCLGKVKSHTQSLLTKEASSRTGRAGHSAPSYPLPHGQMPSKEPHAPCGSGCSSATGGRAGSLQGSQRVKGAFIFRGAPRPTPVPRAQHHAAWARPGRSAAGPGTVQVPAVPPLSRRAPVSALQVGLPAVGHPRALPPCTRLSGGLRRGPGSRLHRPRRRAHGLLAKVRE